MTPKLATPPVVIVHSDAPEDRPWRVRLEKQLIALRVPFWAESELGQFDRERFQEVLDSARVVLVLISADLIAFEPDLCALVRERLRAAKSHNRVAVRLLLVRACAFDQDLLIDAKIISDEPLGAMDDDEAERYLAETARRVQGILRSAFSLDIRDLLNDRPRDVAAHINRVVQLLDQAGRYLKSALSDIADVAAYLLQELLGCGARMPSKQDDPALIEHVERRLIALCNEASSELTDETYHQVYTVIQCLEALRSAPPMEQPSPRPGLNAVQGLLPLWVRAASLSIDDEAWENLCSTTLQELPSYYADPPGRGGRRQRPLPMWRIFHCIWLCALVLRECPPRAADVRADLAYVLREALRFLCFGFEDNEEQRRSYYYFDTARYTSALRTVVTYHATQVLGEPFGPLIGSFLRTLASTRGVNHYSPGEHLQHILEIYMSGNFILSVRLGGRRGGLTLAELLRGNKRDDQVILDARRAFILAALFHDVGHLVLPRIRSNIGEFGLSVLPLRDKLDELRESLCASINRFAATCADRLASYAAEPELAAWLAEQRERPGHGLLGAWYLLDICHDSGLDEGVLRSAIRAVLLHNALSVQLSADNDPIAALLVLADELYEWDPMQPLSPRSLGKSLQVIAPEVPAHEPRDRWIRVEQLRFGDELRASLDITDGTEAWPTIHIELQGPQRLTMPIYKLWFRKSQNLGRIVRAKCGFGPTVVMTSVFPCDGDTNLARIEALKGELPAELLLTLESWLLATNIDVQDQHETIRLRSFEDHPELHAGLPRLLEYIREQVRED